MEKKSLEVLLDLAGRLGKRMAMLDPIYHEGFWAALDVLVRSLEATPEEREEFFSALGAAYMERRDRRYTSGQ